MKTDFTSCKICSKIPDEYSYDGLSAGALPPEAFSLRDAAGRPPEPGRDGETKLRCPLCGCEYSLKCDVGGGEWYVSLRRTV